MRAFPVRKMYKTAYFMQTYYNWSSLYIIKKNISILKCYLGYDLVQCHIIPNDLCLWQVNLRDIVTHLRTWALPDGPDLYIITTQVLPHMYIIDVTYVIKDSVTYIYVKWLHNVGKIIVQLNIIDLCLVVLFVCNIRNVCIILRLKYNKV